MKRFSAWLVCLALVLCMLPAASAASVYSPGMFEDVQESAWYGDDHQGVIRGVVEAGLMEGMGDGRFGIRENITLAQAVVMAVRMHAGGDTESDASPWYAPYVSYAENHGMLDLIDDRDYGRAAKRWEVAVLFALAQPEQNYPAINTVEALPDVSEDDSYASCVFLLYRAGVLTGSDELGSFRPDSPILREEAAAVLLRAADPDRRLTFEPLPAVVTPVLPPNPASGFLWSDYRENMEVWDFDTWTAIATAAYFALQDSYSVTLCGLPFSLKDLTAYMDEFYHRSYFYCTYYDQTGILSVEYSYSLFDYMNGAVRGADENRLSSEAKHYLAILDEIIASCISPGMSEREIARALHDYMVLNYEYDTTAVNGSSAYGQLSWSFKGLLDNGVGVCQAYTELYYLLCCRAGLHCEIVTGTSYGISGWSSHAWNVLYFTGEAEPLYVDVTFDDPIGAGKDYISHEYFLLDADTLSVDHIW
ncbi:MAG: S-layer homology domain-containing protein [Eubacteriales bacterium]|nr:S-layer homology domain-containing protein [Eubacteriales bacterium]